MLRTVILIGLVACTFAEQISFKKIEDVEKFRVEHSDLIKFKTVETRESLKHYLGSRVTGDRILGEVSGGDQFNRPSNVAYEVSFGPTNGERLTAIIVRVNQSSSKGRAYISRGGLGQVAAIVVVEALDTTYVDYVVEFYGK